VNENLVNAMMDAAKKEEGMQVKYFPQGGTTTGHSASGIAARCDTGVQQQS